MKISPPRRALDFLRWFCREDYLEEIEGDLTEVFEKEYQSTPRKAKWKFTWSVIKYFRPEFMKSFKNYQPNSLGMYRSYFKISWRNLVRQKLYSTINIGGLALALTCFMTILLYVQHEFSYNSFYENADHIYRVYQKQTGNVHLGTDYFAVTPAQLASVMREEFPEVVYATSVEQSSGLLSIGDQHFWKDGLAGDSQFFDVFTILFMEGNSKTALADPKSIVLTRSLAKTIFGDESPVGRSLHYQDEEGYHVTAVIDDPPSNSSLRYSFIVNILYNKNYVESMKRTGWSNNSFHTFFVLADDADPSSVEKKFPALLAKYQLPEDYADYPFNDQYFIQPLADIYFQSHINSDIGIKGNRDAVYLFSIVALIVLLLACVNYMNLAVARSIKRSREVGLRKVVGAVRRQLIGQFLGESVLIAFLSLLLAVGLTYLLLPCFGRMMERPVELNFLSNPLLLPGLLLLVLLVGIFSGSYPALMMSSLRPMEVLKARADVKVSGFSLQRLLIIVQFAVSITLVISSLVIWQQLQYMQQKELGYDKEDVVAIRLIDRSLRGKFQHLSNEWSQNQHILSATMSSHLPTHITSSSIISNKPGADEKEGLAIYQWQVEYNFMDVFGIKLLAGRNFSQEMSNDSEQSYLINETAAKALGWTPEEAIGKQIYHGDSKNIIGVVRDFHMHSMHLPIQPLMIRLSENRGSYISVKVKHGEIPETLAYLEKSIKANSPYPLDYQFLDENFKQLYASEMKLGEIFGFFTVVSVLIASLGLFGLAAFLSGQRTKEIGIRKVLGASVQSIVVLVSKDFLRLVFIAFIVSIPVGWYAMHSWLQDFAYRVNIEWWTFALAGVLAFVIANLSIGYQSLKASLMNPVDSLQSE